MTYLDEWGKGYRSPRLPESKLGRLISASHDAKHTYWICWPSAERIQGRSPAWESCSWEVFSSVTLLFIYLWHCNGAIWCAWIGKRINGFVRVTVELITPGERLGFFGECWCGAEGSTVSLVLLPASAGCGLADQSGLELTKWLECGWPWIPCPPAPHSRVLRLQRRVCHPQPVILSPENSVLCELMAIWLPPVKEVSKQTCACLLPVTDCIRRQIMAK